MDLMRFYKENICYWDLNKKKYIPQEKYRSLIHLGMSPEEIYKDYAKYYDNVKEDENIESRKHYIEFLKKFINEKIAGVPDSEKENERKRWKAFAKKMLSAYDMGQSHKRKFVFGEIIETLTRSIPEV